MNQKQILMSSPDFFKVEYSINPWMVAGVTVDLDLAKNQWNNLKSTIERAGAEVKVVPPSEEYPDLVFTANSGIINGKNVLIANFKYEWIWEKPQGTNPMNSKIMPLKSHENILVFYRKKPTYNPQMWYSTPYGGFSSNTSTIGEVYGKQQSKHRDNPEGSRYPKTILKYKQEKGLHPTQKPVGLMEYLIKTSTNESETGLDNTMGSGTTGLACMNTNRNFIGIESDEKYYKIAEERINIGKLPL